MVVIPVTNCFREQSFSKLNIVKTKSRSNIKQKFYAHDFCDEKSCYFSQSR